MRCRTNWLVVSPRWGYQNPTARGRFPRLAPSLYHTNRSFWFFGCSEGFPVPGQVSHPLESFPNRFDTGWVFAVRANHVVAEARDPSYHFTKFRRRCRQRLATMRHRPHRLPFRSVENRLAVQVRTTPPQPTHEQRSPRNDHVNHRAGQHAWKRFKQSLLNPTA